jgi:quercetin dioxygenase-like cupin family protein
LSGNIQDGNTYSDGGESFAYVIGGTCELYLDGKRITLEEGDSVYFDSSLEHRFRASDGSRATVVEVKEGRS